MTASDGQTLRSLGLGARTVDVGGLLLHVTLDGPARAVGREPVLVLHGFTGAAESMLGVAEALSDRWPVLRLDLVGHGASDAPRIRAPYAMDACVAQVTAVLDALGFSRVHVLGYSMGGRVALSLAVAHPERVLSMLLVGASAGLQDPEERAARVRADEALADRIESVGLEAFVEAWMALPLFASQKRLGEDALAISRRQRLRNRAHGLAMSLRGMGSGAQPPLQAHLAEVRVPACLVAGDEDAKFRGIAEDLVARLPRGEVALIPEAGHAAHLENPRAFGALARDFFDRHEDAESAGTSEGGGRAASARQ